MPIWTTELNADSSINFAAELAKDVSSKGTFLEDYNQYCSAAAVVPCPYVTVSGGEVLGTAAKIGGCAIDLSSWRAALLAVCTVNSPIKEVAIMHCALTQQHLTELALALEKIGNLQVLKLDYIRVTDLTEAVTLTSLLKPFVWGASAPVEYLSLKGNCLGDDFALDPSVYSALAGNFTLTALSLADNGISDDGASKVLQAARLSVALREISFAKNSLSGTPILFTALCELLAGTGVASSEDESTWKSCMKVIGDRNKALKDINKKRKKGGYAELPDVATPAERLAKVDGANAIANRGIQSVDLSFNPWDAEGAGAAFAGCLSTLREPCRIPGAAPLAVRIEVRGSVKTALSLELGGQPAEGEDGGVVVVA